MIGQRRLMKAPLLVAVALALAALPRPQARAQAADGVAGTLPEDYLPALRPILAGAASRSPGALQSALDLAQAEGARYQHASQLWPSVNLSANYSGDEQSTNGGPVNTQTGLYYDLGVNQPVFQWGAYRANAEIGRLGGQIARRQYAEAYRQLALTLRRQYTALVSRASEIEGLRFQAELADKALELARQRARSGAVSPAAASHAARVVAETRLGLDRELLDYSYARRVFCRTAGLDDLPADAVPRTMDKPAYPAALADRLLAGFIAGGVNTLDQNRILDMQVEQADLSYRIARVQLLPKFALTLDYRVQDQSTVSPATASSQATVNQYALRQGIVGVSMNWSIFDGFSTRGARLIALASRRSAERQRQASIDEHLDEARNRRASLDLTYRGLEIAEERRLDGHGSLDKAREDLRLGVGSEAAVQESLAGCNSADLGALESRIEFVNQWAEFVSSVGADPVAGNR